MTIDCTRAANLKIAGVVINGFDATCATVAEETAEEVIAECSGIRVLATLPFDETVDIEQPNLPQIIIDTLGHCNWEELARI